MKTFIKYGSNGIVISGVTVKSYKQPSGEGWVEIPSTLCCETPPRRSNSRLKAFVKFTRGGDVIPGSLIIRKSKPKSGKWMQVPYTKCCEYLPLVPSVTSITGDPEQVFNVTVTQGQLPQSVTSVTSNNTDVATASVSGSGVTITLVGTGTTTVVINGGGESTSITVTVPELIAVPDSVEGSEGDSVDVEVYRGQGGTLNDIDSAESADEDVATVAVEDGVATITFVAAGETTVELTVGDEVVEVEVIVNAVTP